jgi:hypothetical protein
MSVLSTASYSQNNASYSENENESEKKYQLSSFVVNCLEGKAYVKWEVLEPSNDCVYVLERSSDNKHYQPIFAKQGSASPGNIQLLHCFIDENPVAGSSYYRLRRLSKEGINVSTTVGIVNNGSRKYNAMDESTALSFSK